MVVILIRRFARPDRMEEFLRVFAEQRPPRDNPDFLGETLTRLASREALPAGVPSLVPEAADAVTFVNVARWRSLDAFARQFAGPLAAPGGFDPAIEVARAEITVLDPVAEAGPADAFAG